MKKRRDSEVERFRTGWIRERRDSGLEGFRNAGIQDWRDSGMQGFRNAGIQDWRDSGRLNSTICFKMAEAKQLVRQGFCPPIRHDDLCLVF